jgi:hypothetical protein
MFFISQIIEPITETTTNWTLNGWGRFARALVNAGLAEQKNRSRLAWFLGSIVLGPIATPLIVMRGWPADGPVELLLPFSDQADRYFTLAGVISFLTLLGTRWYHRVGGAVAGVIGVGFAVFFLVLYQRARRESRAELRDSTPATDPQTEDAPPTPQI